MASYLISWKPATENKNEGWPEEENGFSAQLQKKGSVTLSISSIKAHKVSLDTAETEATDQR